MSDIPWSEAGVYILTHRVEWHMSGASPSAWRDFLAAAGCDIRAGVDGRWSAFSRVLPTELAKWRPFLYLRAHNDREGEVHLILEMRPIPDTPPSVEILEETRRAESIEKLLGRLAGDAPPISASDREIESTMLILFEHSVWTKRLEALKLLSAPIQHHGVLFQPEMQRWTLSNAKSLRDITTFTSAHDGHPAMSVRGQHTFLPDAGPFAQTQAALWDELCALLNITSH